MGRPLTRLSLDDFFLKHGGQLLVHLVAFPRNNFLDRVFLADSMSEIFHHSAWITIDFSLLNRLVLATELLYLLFIASQSCQVSPASSVEVRAAFICICCITFGRRHIVNVLLGS